MKYKITDIDTEVFLDFVIFLLILKALISNLNPTT
jgi:hypothetical protein